MEVFLFCFFEHLVSCFCVFFGGPKFLEQIYDVYDIVISRVPYFPWLAVHKTGSQERSSRSSWRGVVFVEMAMEAVRAHLGPEAQLRDVQMVWPFVVPKAWEKFPFFF